MKSIYELNLHETLEMSSSLSCIRVPGGWIYNHVSESQDMNGKVVDYYKSSVFIPFDNEFQGKWKQASDEIWIYR